MSSVFRPESQPGQMDVVWTVSKMDGAEVCQSGGLEEML